MSGSFSTQDAVFEYTKKNYPELLDMSFNRLGHKRLKKKTNGSKRQRTI